MNALVTGSTGFIGSHLVESLIKRNYRVRCLIRANSDLKWIKDLDVEWVTGSYQNKDSLTRAVKGMHYIFHVGAVISARDWKTYYEANVEGTVNLLKACAIENPGLKKFVFVSSIAAAGPSKDKIPIKEDDECRPVSLYGKSKFLAEKEAAPFFDKLPIVIIRPTNILGPRQKELYSVLKMVSKRIIPMLGNGDKQTTICFVQDLVRALITAAENHDIRGRTYFVAAKEPRSWQEMLISISREMGQSFVIRISFPFLLLIASLLEIMAQITGGSPLISRRRVLSVRKNYWLHDVSRIQDELGFKAEVIFSEGMKDILEWYKDRKLL
jgi:nucleoside-diphosphate-sugar epimerase